MCACFRIIVHCIFLLHLKAPSVPSSQTFQVQLWRRLVFSGITQNDKAPRLQNVMLTPSFPYRICHNYWPLVERFP